MTELDVSGRRCLSFTVGGEWAHFRRIDTTNDKQTYRVIPRTTASGLIAAILGEPRDSYYDKFTQADSAMAIAPQRPLRTMSVPMLTIPTTEADLGTTEATSGKTVVKPSTLEEKRQRRTFEYLRRPAYRIHLILNDEQWFERLCDRLDARDADTPKEEHQPTIRPVYTPSLGKSECLAEIQNPVVGTVSSAIEATHVDSTVPESRLSPQAGISYDLERTPTHMEQMENGRRTTGFESYAYPRDGDGIELSGVTAHEINGDTVCFI